jgi:hypothetical protein
MSKKVRESEKSSPKYREYTSSCLVGLKAAQEFAQELGLGVPMQAHKDAKGSETVSMHTIGLYGSPEVLAVFEEQLPHIDPMAKRLPEEQQVLG